MFAAWVLLRDVALFLFAVGGLAMPWLPLLRRWPTTERLTLAIGGALLVGHLAAFAIYVSGVDWRWFWVAPALGVVLGWRRGAWDPEWRQPLLAYAALALWCLGWHALVVTYSGAAWQVDWWEHYDRAHFFLARWPLGFHFADIYPLTARPPLVNLWAAAFLSGSGGAYFNYQVFMTLASCLAVLPLVALVQRWRGDSRGVPVLLGVLMACPLFVQNATFPWTKLVCAFFVLAAWLQLTATDGTRGRYVAGALALTGATLAHYSAGPWIIALAAAWFVTHRRELAEASHRREIVLASAAAGALLFTWIGWAAAHYGWHSTFADNTTIAIAPGGDLAARAARAFGNLFHTVWPISTVGLDHPLLAQSSALGRLRDGWFILYQLKLWWALGATGALVLLATLWRERSNRPALFATVATVVLIVLGTVVHSHPDVLGLTHIALQPLVLLALAWLAARAPAFPPWLRRLWLAGLSLDLACGIALHFGVQSGLLDRWLRDVPTERIWESYTQAAAAGFENKVNLRLTFLADLSTPLWAIALLAGAVPLGIAVWRREMTFPARPPSP